MATVNRLGVFAVVAAVLALALPIGCGNDDNPAASTARATHDAGRDGIAAAHAGVVDVAVDARECFMGTPKTNEELLNSCWPDDVAAVTKKPSLPMGYQLDGGLLPTPPPP